MPADEWIMSTESEWDSTTESLANLDAWVRATFQSCEVAGPTNIRLRPWSITGSWEVATDTGDERYWAKATPAEFFTEAPVLRLLAGHPTVPALVACDDRQRFTLVTDHGTTIRRQPKQDLRVWEAAIDGYAAIQQGSQTGAQGIRQINQDTFDRYLHGDVINEALDRLLTSHERRQRLAVSSLARAVVERLDERGVPHRLSHDDLHSNNITCDGTIIDWGDASFTHPLASVFTMNYLSDEQGSQFRDLVVNRYLAATSTWSGQPVDELRQMLPAARIYGSLGKMDTWVRLLGYPDPTIHGCVERELVAHYRIFVRDLGYFRPDLAAV